MLFRYVHVAVLILISYAAVFSPFCMLLSFRDIYRLTLNIISDKVYYILRQNIGRVFICYCNILSLQQKINGEQAHSYKNTVSRFPISAWSCAVPEKWVPIYSTVTSQKFIIRIIIYLLFISPSVHKGLRIKVSGYLGYIIYYF